MPKKIRGVIARTKKALGIKPSKPKAKPKAKRTKVAGGYSSPKPRKRLLDEAGNISSKKKKK